MSNFSSERRMPEKLSEEIIQFILDRHLKPGDKLPTEYVLAHELNAGRSTVREAMKLLASRNIVEIRQGSGSYVSEKKGQSDDPLGLIFIEDKVKLAKDLIDIRIIMEPYMAALSAQKSGRAETEEIIRCCDEMEDLILKKQPYKGKDIEFHIAIANSTKNLAASWLVPVITHSIEIPLESHLRNSSFYKMTIETHRAITNAIVARDPLVAQDAMYFHLVFNRQHLQTLEREGLIPKKPSLSDDKL